MITHHQYIERYPILPDSQKLILGTIHPHHHKEFKVPFFYGSRLSLWKLLSNVFPHDLSYISLRNIIQFLVRQKIWVSDTISSCRRQSRSALDKDLIPMQLNDNLLSQIRESDIHTILCTSAFERNNAFRIFYVEMLKLKLTSKIREEREVILDESVFGRKIRLVAMYSPSGSANTELVNSKRYKESASKYKGVDKPIKAFKTDLYREYFS